MTAPYAIRLHHHYDIVPFFVPSESQNMQENSWQHTMALLSMSVLWYQSRNENTNATRVCHELYCLSIFLTLFILFLALLICLHTMKLAQYGKRHGQMYGCACQSVGNERTLCCARPKRPDNSTTSSPVLWGGSIDRPILLTRSV